MLRKTVSDCSEDIIELLPFYSPAHRVFHAQLVLQGVEQGHGYNTEGAHLVIEKCICIVLDWT